MVYFLSYKGVLVKLRSYKKESQENKNPLRALRLYPRSFLLFTPSETTITTETLSLLTSETFLNFIHIWLLILFVGGDMEFLFSLGVGECRCVRSSVRGVSSVRMFARLFADTPRFPYFGAFYCGFSFS